MHDACDRLCTVPHFYRPLALAAMLRCDISVSGFIHVIAFHPGKSSLPRQFSGTNIF
jgi:hypothetical protein